MKRLSKGLIAAALFAAVGITVHGSSHREALAILNEPCADNTDTYAWVSDNSHDKLYLIMDFNPLHEPGQGNQGFRACNGYRYEFHVGKGASLKDEAVYRIREVDSQDEEIAEALDELHRATFLDSAPVPSFDEGYWWLAFRGMPFLREG